MDVCCLQHAPYEGPGEIQAWALAHGHDFRITRLRDEPLPNVQEFDLLVVMGGPMGVHDVADYPWLLPEKRLIGQCLADGKFVLGVCLGSQILAEVLGARFTGTAGKRSAGFQSSAAHHGMRVIYSDLSRPSSPFSTGTEIRLTYSPGPPTWPEAKPVPSRHSSIRTLSGFSFTSR